MFHNTIKKMRHGMIGHLAMILLLFACTLRPVTTDTSDDSDVLDLLRLFESEVKRHHTDVLSSANIGGEGTLLKRTPPPECIAATEGKYLPALNDRCYYYKCQNVKPVLTSCPDGLAVPGVYIYQNQPLDNIPCILPYGKCKPDTDPISDTPVCGIDLVIAVDVSCSVAAAVKESVRTFLMDLIRGYPIGSELSKTQVGLLTFDKRVRRQFYLNEKQSLMELEGHIKDMSFNALKCQTRTHKALDAIRKIFFTQENGDRPDAANVLILVTDGRTWPARFKPAAIAQATKLKEQNVKLFVVGLPNRRHGKDSKTSTQEWTALASTPTDTHLYPLDNYNQLSNIVKTMASSLCEEGESQRELVEEFGLNMRKAGDQVLFNILEEQHQRRQLDDILVEIDVKGDEDEE